MRTHFITLFAIMLSVSTNTLFADDTEARAKIDEAIQAEAHKDYVDAGNLYMDAELLADDTTLKANVLRSAANAYRHGERYFKEYECTLSLIRGFRNHIDYPAAVERLFDIGDRYYQGYREPPAEWLAWTGIPGKNKMIEIYEAALREAPYAKRAAQTKLRLARLLIDGDAETTNRQKGIAFLRDVTQNYPKTMEQKNAYLQLAQVLSKLSMYKDGSETYTQEAQELLRHIIMMYPEAPEIPWAKDQLQRLNEDAAERHLRIADFYAKSHNPAGENFELQKLMRDYNGTKAAKVAARRLSEIQPALPPPIVEAIPKQEPLFQPADPFFERKDILVVPGERGSPYLLPVEDYSWDLSRNRAEAEKRRAADAKIRDEAIKDGLLKFLDPPKPIEVKK